MRYLSVCSGIEAATCAWHPLGWTPVAFAEIEPFPSAVLKHHYPNVPNLGDFTKIEAADVGPIDLLVGGTPCQSFSVAGLRGGLADDRGNLALEFLRLAQRTRPKWLVWENVPGVLSSNGGRDFGSILGGMGELGYGWAYRVLDAQHFGVPQRRRRVFVVGHLGDWRRAAAVLFERHSLQGHPPPRRQAGEGTTGPIAGCSNGGGANGPGRTADDADSLIAQTLLGKANDSQDTTRQTYVARCDTARQQRYDGETETFVTHALRADGFDASEDGTGRGTPLTIIPLQEVNGRQSKNQNGTGLGVGGDVMYTLQSAQQHGVCAFSSKDHGADAGELAPTLRAGGHSKSHANAGVPPAIAFDTYNSALSQEAATLRNGHGEGVPAAMAGTSVRRLTPRECERLQGFKDDYTLIPFYSSWVESHAAEMAAYLGMSKLEFMACRFAKDGPRYKAIGNSMAVPVMHWIGERINLVSRVKQPADKEAA